MTIELTEINQETSEKIVPRMIQCLSNLEQTNEFSVGGLYNLPPYPGINIKGFGIISFPVTTIIAESLTNVATVVSKNTLETKLNDTIGHVWELNSSLISFMNPEWSTSISNLVSHIGQVLEFNGSVSAILSKALLYQEGGDIDFDKDTEKDFKKFGTLMIQLPSICTGGRLVTRFKGKENDYDFGTLTGQTAFASHFVAYYDDVQHSLEKLKSGYRFVLVYSLVWNSFGNPPSALENSDRSLKLKNLMVRFSKQHTMERFGILLDHKYTFKGIENMGLKSLKGHDKLIYQTLRNVITTIPKRQKIRMFLVELVRHATFDGEKDDDDQIEWDLNFDRIVFGDWTDGNGNLFELGEHLKLSMNDIYDLSIDKDGLTYHDEAWWGDSIKKDVQLISFDEAKKREIFQRYVLVIYPSLYEFDYLLQAVGPLAALQLLLLDVRQGNARLKDKRFQKFLEKWDGVDCYGWSHDHCLETINDKIVEHALCYVTKLQSVELFGLLSDRLKEIVTEKSIDTFSIPFLLQHFRWRTFSSTLLPILVKKNDFLMVKELLDENLIDKTDEVGEAFYELFVNCPIPIESRNVADEFQTFRLWEKQELASKVATFLVQTLTSKGLETLCEILTKDLIIIPVTDISLRMIVQKQYENLSTDILKGVPSFSWSLPFSIPSHPIVTDFLKSNEQQMDYKNFDGKLKARKWVNQHFDTNGLKSVTTAISGVGKNSYVSITKTKDYYQQLCDDYKRMTVEHDRLEMLLQSDTIKSANKKRRVKR
ncbi:hypothetical protein BC833DRAFT_143929 [Globomyces pollinis-pini]|nr:hypothetical protein BC833DRAFT_143929 [Globomyces pollinis-pini]